MNPVFRRGSGWGETILVDLDSTLADTRPRRHLAPTVDASKTWTDYSLGCAADAPIAGTIRFVQMLDDAGYQIHIVTGRHASARGLTEDWLSHHHIPYTRLVMRQPGEEHIDSGALKLIYVADQRRRGYTFVLALEDNVDIAHALEARGVPVLCCNPRYGSRP